MCKIRARGGWGFLTRHELVYTTNQAFFINQLNNLNNESKPAIIIINKPHNATASNLKNCGPSNAPIVNHNILVFINF